MLVSESTLTTNMGLLKAPFPDALDDRDDGFVAVDIADFRDSDVEEDRREEVREVRLDL